MVCRNEGDIFLALLIIMFVHSISLSQPYSDIS